jgi:alkanesulfonate monooxygenase SsuD/methylene tetrahydromethanopterin reductase-like flavin-dependent oxidoreductase (luciferase family)
MLATLDHLAPGRVILGAGVGWMREEIELFGVEHGRRGAWSDEALRVMQACWRDERVSFAGEFFRFDALGFAPKPARGTIPVWIGGHTPRAFRRVAELGDGWHAAFPSPASLREGLAALRVECERRGRDPGTLTVSARIGLPARRIAETAAQIRALGEAGVAHVILESRADDLARMVAVYEELAATLHRA